MGFQKYAKRVIPANTVQERLKNMPFLGKTAGITRPRAGRSKPDAMTEIRDVSMSLLPGIADAVIIEYDSWLSGLDQQRTFTSLHERHNAEKTHNEYWGITPDMMTNACRNALREMWGDSIDSNKNTFSTAHVSTTNLNKFTAGNYPPYKFNISSSLKHVL